MITDERVSAFINSLDRGNTDFLNEIEDLCRKTNVPVIRPQMQSLLKMLLAASRPKKILEVGTAIGFSALFMSEYAPKGCMVTTIEKYEKRIPLAKENFCKAGKEKGICLLEGDAAEILAGLDEEYDFIFMDAAKGQYLNFLPSILSILRPGGILVSDNILHDCDVLESRYAVKRRDRTIHARMREYLYTITHMEELETICLSLGDGVTVSTRMNSTIH